METTKTSGFDSFTAEQKAIVKQALTNIERKKGKEYAPTSKEIQTEIDLIEAVNPIEFTRVNNDVNGNPRYVCHYSELLNDSDRLKAREMQMTGKAFQIEYEYKLAIQKAKTIGGRKYHNKSYGGGIVFQSYNIKSTEESILKLKNS